MIPPRLALVALVVAVQILTCPTSYASVHGDPDPRDPSVVLTGEERGNTHTKPVVERKQCDNSLCRPLRCMDEADGTTYCFGNGPGADARPDLTPGYVLAAARRVGLPSLGINIQPGDATLVNLDTIFYARPQPFARSVTLLGYDIDLRATPVLYTWHHGDGTSHTTSEPGAPYPAKTVTYRYQQPADHVRPSVDVTYRVRYRVDGGGWQTLNQTLTATGQQNDLEVKEAGAVLTGN